MSQQSQSSDDLAVLTGKTALFLIVLIVCAIIAFQAFDKILQIDPYVTKLIGGAFITLIYFFYKQGKKQAGDPGQQVSKRPLILYIEDQAIQQDIVRWGFQRMNFAVDLLGVPTAEQALEMLTRRDILVVPPDIILLDLYLGESKMTGQGFLRTIKANRDLAFIPVVVLTAMQRDSAADQTILQTVHAYIEWRQGLTAVKEAIEDIQNPDVSRVRNSEEFIQLRKMNHDLRGSLSALISAHDLELSKDEMAKVVLAAKATIADASATGKFGVIK